MSEAGLERRLAAEVKRRGGAFIKLQPYLVGLPDRLVVLPGGRTIFIELKTPTGRGRLSAHQEEWLDRLWWLGAEVHVCANMEECSAALGPP